MLNLTNLTATYPAEKGVHCGSAALANLSRFYGNEIDEAMAFGLASGLGFTYTVRAEWTPSRVISLRATPFEASFFANVGVVWDWCPIKGERLWEAVEGYLRASVPVLARCDLRHLPYYRTEVPFTGHAIVVLGYDRTADVVFLADSEYRGVQTVPRAAYLASLRSDQPPLPTDEEWAPVFPFRIRDLAASGRRALRRNALWGLRYGVPAMRAFAADLARWPTAAADQWRAWAKYSYEMIEYRGTGGAAFRPLYAGFLRQMEELCPELEGAGLAGDMEAIASVWSAFARTLRRAGKAGDAEGLATAATAMEELAEREEVFWRRVTTLLPDD